MFTRELLGLLPRQRVRAVDGMAVTAEVWEESHEYHRLLLRLHALLQHGSGIVGGLDVIASDPADSSVYVLPGLAIDGIGNLIILPEPRAYDLGGAEGLLYLIVSYTESRPQTTARRVQEDAPLYVQSQFTLEAVAKLPSTPHVELARIHRRGQTSPITTAKEFAQPRVNEIDLRFRTLVGQPNVMRAMLGVVTLRGAESTRHGEGLANVAASMRQNPHVQVWVDRGLTLAADLGQYDLVYVVGRDAVQLTSDEMNALYTYWQGGGVIFFESCRAGQTDGDPGADVVFRDLLAAFGTRLEPMPPTHALFAAPNLFAQPPDGFETRGAPALLAAERVIMSTFDYGCMWRGERRGRQAQRGEIRNALEFGANVVHWAIAQRQAAKPGAAR
jgi:hypothetical protein